MNLMKGQKHRKSWKRENRVEVGHSFHLREEWKFNLKCARELNTTEIGQKTSLNQSIFCTFFQRFLFDLTTQLVRPVSCANPEYLCRNSSNFKEFPLWKNEREREMSERNELQTRPYHYRPYTTDLTYKWWLHPMPKKKFLKADREVFFLLTILISTFPSVTSVSQENIWQRCLPKRIFKRASLCTNLKANGCLPTLVFSKCSLEN